MDIKDVKVEKAQELVLQMDKTIFGELERAVMKKNEKDNQKEVFLQCVCALLNSGGGVLRVITRHDDYNYQKEGLGMDLEQGLSKLLDGARIQDFVKIKQEGQTIQFFVKSWCLAEGKARLCSLNTGLLERSETSACSMSSSSVVDFLNRDTYRKSNLQPGEDTVYDKACEFYNRKQAHYNRPLNFGEGAYVEFKSVLNGLLPRLKEIFPRYLSAFGNTSGGFLFIGINDQTKEVVGCGQGWTRDKLEEKVQTLCDEAEQRAIHITKCKDKKTWSLESKVFPVTSEQPYIVAVKIPPFCCAVFEKDPESWEVQGDKVSQINYNDWWEKMQLPIPDDCLLKKSESALNHQEAPPHCKPVYSIEKIAELQKGIFVTDTSHAVSICDELFKDSKVQSTFTNLQENSGILIVSQSWAFDINRFKNENAALVADALLITSGDYPKFYSIVENESPELWTYARETAFHLKQKLVNVGGYTGWICVIPHLVMCNTGELIQNENNDAPSEYPQSYKLSGKEEIEALLRSLVNVVPIFTLPLSEKLGSEFLNLLTREQSKILHDKNKHLFIHGLPGTGKTVLAMEKMKEIRKMCSKDNILFLCENVGLKAFMSKHNLCICETRFEFMKKDISEFSAVKHVVVDEGQNFRDEDGDWYGRAQELTRDEGVLWVFLDYFQKCHIYSDGLPPLKDQLKSGVQLHSVVRKSKKVYGVMKNKIKKMVRKSSGEMQTHLRGLKKNRTHGHICKGNFHHIPIKSGSGNIGQWVSKEVKTIVNNLLNKGHSASDIAVLFPEGTNPALTTLQNDSSFPHRDVERIDDDVVVLDTIPRFSGLERNIVIVVDSGKLYKQNINSGLLLSAYSRARIKLYIIN